jgi:hypothetical protein
MGEPFADWVTVTVPADRWEDLRPDIQPMLDALGMSVEVDDGQVVLWRSPDARGTVKASRIAKVWALGCSGTVCAALRNARTFNSYLAAIGAGEHRVTRLDASLDVPKDAPGIIRRLVNKGRKGALSLTRKVIKPGDVRTFLSARADGVVTGTAYFGPKSADARMTVYDKRHERIGRKLPDCGPLTRYEIRLKAGTGITLRDCAEPAGVFWHYASPDFLKAPLGVDWVAGGSGFVLGVGNGPMLPAARLDYRVQESPEVGALLRLAEEVGPYGFDFLVGCLRKRAGVK